MTSTRHASGETPGGPCTSWIRSPAGSRSRSPTAPGSTPNELTVFSLVLGLVSAAFLATDRLVAGAVLFYLSFMIDCVDGKIARLKGTGTPFGLWLDYVGDRIRVVLCAGGPRLRAVRADRRRRLHRARRGGGRARPVQVRQRAADEAGARAVREVKAGAGAAARRRELERPSVPAPTASPSAGARAARGGCRVRAGSQLFRRLNRFLARRRVRSHLISGIEFHAAVFVIAPLVGACGADPALGGGQHSAAGQRGLPCPPDVALHAQARACPSRGAESTFSSKFSGVIDMSDRPVFVIGCPRSGTTMLQLMLHSHPRIAVPPETRFLVPAYYRRRTFGDLRDGARRRALARVDRDRPQHQVPRAQARQGRVRPAGRGRPGLARLGDRHRLPDVRRAVRQGPLGRQAAQLRQAGRHAAQALPRRPVHPPDQGRPRLRGLAEGDALVHARLLPRRLHLGRGHRRGRQAAADAARGHATTSCATRTSPTTRRPS